MTGAAPAPEAARERWLDSLARAGWTAGSPGGGDAERVPVGEALGRVAAGPVVARWPSPRGACAAMDGIAMAADVLALLEAGERDAGETGAGGPRGGPGEGGTALIPVGAFEWIDTGDPMPDWADTVIERERLTQLPDGGLLLAAGPGRHPGRAGATGTPKGRNVRAVGEDFMAGEELVPAGRRLRPGDLAAAAAGGLTTLAVTRRPAVAIIPTGDEIRPVGTPLGRGEIMDTNSLMLAARCRQLGVVPLVSDVVPDDPDTLAAEIRRASVTADLVLVIAGSSRGRDDHAGAVLAQVGGVAVAGIAVRPGHPALLGHVKRPCHNPPCPPDGQPGTADRGGTAPVIGLPGYPLATAVIFELFGVPLLAAVQGQVPARHRVRARLDRDWWSRAATEDWVLVTLNPAGDGGLPLATPARRGSAAMSLLARAAAWWPIPADREEYTAGAEIEVLPIPGGD